jgi:WD40 repeat protein
MRLLQKHTGDVRGLAYSPDSSILASCGEDGTVRLWDLATGTMTTKLVRSDLTRPNRGVAYDVAISPDGQWLASGWSDNRIRLWSLKSADDPILLTGHGRSVTSLAFADQSTLISGAGAGNSAGEAGYWTKLPGDGLFVPVEAQGVWAVAVSPVSGLVALGTSAASKAILFWQPKSLGPSGPGLDGSRVRSLAFTPDGRSLAQANVGGKAVVWDFETSRKRFTLRGHAGRVKSVAFSPDGSMLATASQDGTVRLWDADSGAERACYDWEMGRLGCVAFAPDGMTIAAGGERDVVVWDVEV